MKRIERNTFNSIKKNLTPSTINVEVPVKYSHEARQAIHEYLTIKGMRVTGINWNSIQKCYCIHWEPARTETAEAIRRQQENADIDDVTEGMEYSDWTWNGYKKPTQDAAEAPETAQEAETEEQTTEAQETTTEAAEAASEAHTTEEKKEEENTMKNTSTAAIENAVTLTDIIAPVKNEYAEDLLEYNGTTYICDAISEIADRRTSIYNADILDFISRDPSALAEVVEEGLYEVRAGAGYNLYEHAQAAEYMRIEQDIYNQLDDAILAYAANYLRTAYHVEEIDAETWEAITDDLDDIDNNSRFDEITDIIDEHMTQDSEEEEA